MKQNILNYLAAATLGLAALVATGCTENDSPGRVSEGGIPLNIGNVSITGMEAAGRTRAITDENDATGFTGIRKSKFVNGDVLKLEWTVNDGSGNGNGDNGGSADATLTDGAWTLDGSYYIIPGKTDLTATYTPAAAGAPDMKADVLVSDPSYSLEGQTLTLDMKHANAMIDITLPAVANPTAIGLTGITLTAAGANDDGTDAADETLPTVVEEAAGNAKHYRTIALPGKVKSITATINGQSYVAALAPALPVAANKRYPVSLTFKENKLTAAVGAAGLDWTAGGTADADPAGYTRIIDSPEALAQFAQDVNDNRTEAMNAIVLQTKDIDMALLKPLAKAGNNPLTGSAYTYTATKDNWVPIGKGDRNSSMAKNFYGTYNGNGHTISNVKLTQSFEDKAGFFGVVSGGTLTGIHLRNIQADITLTDYLEIGALAVTVSDGSTVSLCSATGSLKAQVTGVNHPIYMGGLLGYIEDSSFVTRYSADVDLSATGDADIYIGGFAYQLDDSTIAGCFSTGDIDYTTTEKVIVGGFLSATYDCNLMSIVNCFCSGTLKDDTGYGFVGKITDSITNLLTISGCYSTSESRSGGTLKFFGYDDRYTYYADRYLISACACTGDTNNLPNSTSDITAHAAIADLYSAITAGNVTTADPITTLHWSATEGYTLTPVSQTWSVMKTWKDNGTAAPTIDMTYEGGMKR